MCVGSVNPDPMGNGEEKGCGQRGGWGMGMRAPSPAHGYTFWLTKNFLEQESVVNESSKDSTLGFFHILKSNPTAALFCPGPPVGKGRKKGPLGT